MKRDDKIAIFIFLSERRAQARRTYARRSDNRLNYVLLLKNTIMMKH